jgi:aspartate aminotransferase
MDTIWTPLKSSPPDPVFGLIHNFIADTNPKKVLLGVGIYKGEDGKPYVLDSVKKAERIMLDKYNDKEYAFPDGIPSFRQKAIELSWGKDHPALKEQRVASIQTVSGTGGLKLGFMLLQKFFPRAKAYVPNPTWSLHHNIIKSCNFDLTYFRWYNPETKGLDMAGLLEDLNNMEDEQILLLQASCHNPSGCDPTKDEWKQILEVCQKKKHFTFFDSAYQGFASDDYNDDTWSLRHFAENHNRVMLTQSFSKNFGLYGERTGCLSMICKDHEEQLKVQTILKDTCLPEYSNPPIHGARIVDIILGDAELKQQWLDEVKAMQLRLKNNRTEMVQKLAALGSVHDWSHIEKQIGMFAYTGLSKEMTEEMKGTYSIYLPFDGRICVASITQNNIDYVCECMHKVSEGKSI